MKSYLVAIDDSQSHWRCEGCDLKKTVAQIRAITDPLKDELHELEEMGK